MSYIVVYQREDGSSGLEECESLDLAVVAAERLRNVDSVENPRIFKTEEVKFDFRPYYRVEVADSGGGTSEPAPSTPDPVVARATATATTSTATTSTAMPIGESEPAAPPAAPDGPSVSSIDPWAAAESTSVEEAPAPPAPTADGATTAAEAIDYSNDAIPDVMDPPAPPTPEAMPSAEAEVADVSEVDSSRGLFSATRLPEPPKDDPDIGALADDVTDVVPPRRGLFGR